MKRSYPGKSPAQGAATSVFVATRAELGVGMPGYYEDCHPAAVVPAIIDGIHGVLPHALDPDAARRLWDVSVDLVASA